MTTTTTTNPGRAIAKAIMDGDAIGATWELKTQYYIQGDREFQTFLGGIKARLRTFCEANGRYHERREAFALVVQNATGHPLTRWIRKRRKAR